MAWIEDIIKSEQRLDAVKSLFEFLPVSDPEACLARARYQYLRSELNEAKATGHGFHYYDECVALNISALKVAKRIKDRNDSAD